MLKILPALLASLEKIHTNGHDLAPHRSLRRADGIFTSAKVFCVHVRTIKFRINMAFQ
jgi:hypothetical protein